MDIQEIINIDPEVQGGCPVFRGTRVPVEILFDYLEAGAPLAEFLEDFPGVSREQAVGLLEATSKIATAKNAAELYAAAA